MQLEKAKNARRNVVFGVILKIYQILLPFIFRTVMIQTLGVQYLGLNSLFTSVLQVLNLAELGVGSAMVFSMYKPIADDDHIKICALMKLYRLYYRVIGGIVLVVGLAVTPFIPYLISGDVPEGINIYILYLLNLGATVLTYWLFAYKNSILSAHQRADVSSKVTIVTDTIKYGLWLVALYIFKNYYYYVIVILFTQVLNNIITALCAQKLYPQYKAEGQISKEERKAINKRIADLFTSKLGGTLTGSTSTIVISAFLGLEILAIYQNYYYIITSITGFLTIINTSVLAGIGNKMQTGTIKENYHDFRVFMFLQFWMIGFCICCFSALFQPFMKIWMSDGLLLDYSAVVLLCISFLGTQYVQALSVYKDAGGIWHSDRFRPLISGIVNLVIDLILIQFIDIYGVVLANIVSSCFVSSPWITGNVFRSIFKDEKMGKYLIETAIYIVVIAAVAIVVNIICYFIPEGGIGWLILRFAVCIVLSNVVFLLIYFKFPLFKDCIELVKKMFKRKTKNSSDGN